MHMEKVDIVMVVCSELVSFIINELILIRLLFIAFRNLRVNSAGSDVMIICNVSNGNITLTVYDRRET